MMKKSNFDLLMHRYLTGEVTEQERIKIEAWLKIMKAERVDELELSKEDEERLFQKITNSVEGVDDVVARHAVKSPWSRLVSNPAVRVAASLIILVSFFFAIRSVTTGGNLFEVPGSYGKKKLILNDGTLVWLCANSQLQYYHKNEDATSYRVAELRGEGLFEVAKDSTRPFIIRCGDVNVKVVGTSFNLKATNETIELSVLTGKVRVSSTATDTSIDVQSDEKIIYRGRGQFEKSSLTANEEALITTGTEYRMVFVNATVRELIERLEAKFDITVKVGTESINNCLVTVDLTDHSLEGSLQLLTEILHVQYMLRGNEVTLSGIGCE